MRLLFLQFTRHLFGKVAIMAADHVLCVLLVMKSDVAIRFFHCQGHTDIREILEYTKTIAKHVG